MARPIEPTPELRGKDAELLLKQIEERRLTPDKEKELKKDARLFEEKRPCY